MTPPDTPVAALPAAFPPTLRAPGRAASARGRGRRLRGWMLAISLLLHLALLGALMFAHRRLEEAAVAPSFQVLFQPPGANVGKPAESKPTQLPGPTVPPPPAAQPQQVAPPPPTQAPPTPEQPTPAPPTPAPPAPAPPPSALPPQALAPPPPQTAQPPPTAPPPTLRPLTVQPPSAQPPSAQPPSLQPPSAQPPSVQQPSVQPPTTLPPTQARPLALPPAPPVPRTPSPPVPLVLRSPLPAPPPASPQAPATAVPPPPPTLARPTPTTPAPAAPAPAATAPAASTALPPAVPAPPPPAPPRPAPAEEPQVRLSLMPRELPPPRFYPPEPPPPRPSPAPRRQPVFPMPMDTSLGVGAAPSPSRLASRGTGAVDLSLGRAARDSLGAPPRDTNAESGDIVVHGAHVGKDWEELLHEWWLRHGYYPDEAARKGESGQVRIHVNVDRNGHVHLVELESSSGSQWLDMGAQATFRGALLPPFPPSTPEAQADLDITIRYMLIPR